MSQLLRRRSLYAIPVVGLAVWSTVLVRGQIASKAGEWPTYGATLASTRYSPLDQINAANFNKLEVAWRFKTDGQGPRPEYNLEATPLMVNGVMYSTVGTRRSAVALDPTTGAALEELLTGAVNYIASTAANDALPALPILGFVIPASLAAYGLPAGGVLGLVFPALSLGLRHFVLRGALGIR